MIDLLEGVLWTLRQLEDGRAEVENPYARAVRHEGNPASRRLIDDVWAQWLEKDPVRMAPRHADALRSMRRIYLDAGKEDEWFLDLGAQAFSAELDKLGVEHTLELFSGKHGGMTYRYPGAIRELVLALR